MAVRALVDTGAVNLCIPAHVALHPRLEKVTVNPDSPNIPSALVMDARLSIADARSVPM